MTVGSGDDRYVRWRAAQAVQLLAWIASLLPPEVHRLAIAELGGADHVAAEVARAEGPGRRTGRRPDGDHPDGGRPDGGSPTARLREAGSVLECDAALAAGAGVDWPALAAAHRCEPFGRHQRRALIARPDCPDAFTAELLTPWDPRVANRLVARRRELPPWAWRPGLARIGELRPSLLRHVLTGENAADLLRATPRLDLLVAAVDGYDHNHHRQIQAFWEAVGAALRAGVGADPDAWLTAATRLPGHRGSLRGLLRGLRRPAVAGAAGQPDLRVLLQAPPEVLVAVVARYGDGELSDLADRPLRRLRAREYFARTFVDRLHEAGVPPRALFARWALGAYGRATATHAWLHGLDARLDHSIDHHAHADAQLRRLLVWRRPPEPPVVDVVARLRRCLGPVEAQAVLDRACGEAGHPPWPELVRAHTPAPLPEPVLCVLADRAGFPDVLARSLPRERLVQLAGHGPATARAALADLADTSTGSALIDRVRGSGVLDDRELLTAIRPALEALRYGYHLPRQASRRDTWGALCAELAGRAAAAAGPGFWPAAAEHLPGYDGPLPRFLATAGPPSPDSPPGTPPR
ncbi:hypothetical protein [Kitasatospora sp. NPDC058218]|uniref:hypothetical protein n=1 Tax=Kitasatospora sp. NPDC058218 TaxID=3346385 RepID=UPI0036DE84ED